MVLSLSPDVIPLVVVGYGRKNAIIYMPPLYDKTPYLMTASFDLVETLEPYRLTPQNLGAVLHNLHPRPLALVLGIAVDPSYTESMKAVWDEYVETVLKDEFKENDQWKRNAFVPLSATHYVDPSVGKPPADSGWQQEMFRQLDTVFQA